MSDITVTRSPEVIAAEINGIRDHWRMITAQSCVEIGRRLVEAKEQLQHGEWMAWLKGSVDYSQTTANNLMKLYKEYGDDKFPTLANLSYTKAVALIAVPAEEREDFIEEHNVESMSARELQRVIKEKEEAEKRAVEAEQTAAAERKQREQIEKAAEADRKAREDLEKQIRKQTTEVEELERRLEEAKALGNAENIVELEESISKLERDLTASRSKVKQLEKEMREKPVETTVTIEKVPDEIQAKLDSLEKKVASDQSIQRFRAQYEVVTDGFNKLLDLLVDIPETERNSYKGAVAKTLQLMTEKL